MGTRRSLATRFRERRYTPKTVSVGIGCAVIAGVCLAQFGSTTSGADTAFIPGTAVASAQALQVAPTTGGLSYAIILATSQAAYQNEVSQALSQTIDLGAIGLALEANNCATGGPGTLNPKEVPAAAQAESTDGNQTINMTVAPKGSGSGAGVESATATEQPSGSSTTTLAGETLAGLISFSGATSSAHASTSNGTRFANATSDIASLSLLGGKVVLDGLHWAATQTSGASNTSTASFSISGLTVAGLTIPISTNALTTVLTIVNTALSPLGLQVDWPQQTTQSDGTVVISPLTVGIDNNTLGQEIIGANLSKAETVRDKLQQQLLSFNCNLATELTVSDIGLGPLAGGGNVNVQLGGAQAQTTDQAAVSPFGTGASTALPTDTSGDSGLTLPSSTFAIPGTDAIPGTSGVTPSTGSTPSGGQKESLGPVTRTTSCDSSSPAGGGCNSSNLALPVGLIGLALLGVLAAGDYARQRRRSRLSGLEAS
ncbi:MAG TPA: choice-of-anchor P family protein [Acidimicrobiales bacterium]